MRQFSVSAIIPVFNNGPYIAEAVESVLSQTVSPMEIIVVDDGSTDDTAANLQPFREHIKYVYQSNRGEPSARNRGVREATGEYLAFLDGDDVWLPRKLELQMAYLQEHPDCALVYADMSTFNENGVIDLSVRRRFQLPMATGDIFSSLFMKPLFGSGTVIFRRECVDKVGYFDEDLLVGSDYEMWLRISRHFELGCVDEPLLKYRFHPGMSTGTLGLKLNNGVPWEAAVIGKILRLYPESADEIGKKAVRQRLSRPYFRMALARFRKGNCADARELFRQAIAHWPTNYRYWAFYTATFLPPLQIAGARKLYRKLHPARSDT